MLKKELDSFIDFLARLNGMEEWTTLSDEHGFEVSLSCCQPRRLTAEQISQRLKGFFISLGYAAETGGTAGHVLFLERGEDEMFMVCCYPVCLGARVVIGEIPIES